ncbi:uncharacterized protein LOC128552680 [Mercenaria mercenaria]|uniref:uncharacterized protein LOC128552680 n=1 Tax=Mercenaria mercenaria TaxID=6596 RepID=UPI00234E9A82|nr:uncharacterized protein LOC128552680 [Mercenaria mercenaria]
MEHKAQLENIKYRNWVRAGLGIKYVKEGLEPFCDHLVNQQHVAILKKVKQKHNLSAVSCGLCDVHTLQPDHVQTKTRQCPLGQMYCNCLHPRGKISCPNKVCGAIYDEIIQLHASTPPAPNWKNTDAQQWSTEQWTVAKCFINAPGYEAKKSRAAEFDCLGLLHVLINNIEFQQHIKCEITDTDVFSRVRKSRNAIFHSNSMELENTEVNSYIDDMIELLEDETEIKHRQESKDAVKKLVELKQDAFFISTKDEAEIRRVAMAAINEKERELEKTVGDAGNELRNTAAEGKRELESKGLDINSELEATGHNIRKELVMKEDAIKTAATEGINVVAEKGLDIKSELEETGQNIRKELLKKEDEIRSTASEGKSGIEGKGLDIKAELVQTGKKLEQHLTQIKKQLTMKGIETKENLEQKLQESKLELDRKHKVILGNLEHIYPSQPGLKTRNPNMDRKSLTDGSRTDDTDSRKEAENSKKKADFQVKLIKRYEKYVEKVSSVPLKPHRKQRNVNDVYVRPWMTVEIKNEKSKEWEEVEISMHEVVRNKEKPAKYIYVIGDAGTGKSMFCKMLVHFWCIAHSHQEISLDKSDIMIVKEMQNFKFLFYVLLRYSSDCDSIEKMLEKSYHDPALGDILQNESGKCLIVLDGLDEWIPECKHDSQFLTPGLPGRELDANYTIITTSRQWKFDTLQISDTEVDKRIKLRGIDTYQMKRFTEKTVKLLNDSFQQSKNAEKCQSDLQSRRLSDISHIPLILHQLICLWFDDKLRENSWYAIYSNMLALFFERNALKTTSKKQECEIATQARMDVSLLPDYLCDIKALRENIRVIQYLSQLAYETLFDKNKETKLTFSNSALERLNIPNNVTKYCLNIGILIEEQDISLPASSSQKSLFSFFHKSVQEYLAAVYVASQLKEMLKSRKSFPMNMMNNDDHADVCKTCLRKYFGSCKTVVDILDQSNVFIMLCGLESQLLTNVSEYIYDVILVDKLVVEERNTLPKHEFSSDHHNLIKDIQMCIFMCIEGAMSSVKNVHTPVYITDIYVSHSPESDLLRYCEYVVSKYVLSIDLEHFWSDMKETDKETVYLAVKHLGKCDQLKAIKSSSIDDRINNEIKKILDKNVFTLETVSFLETDKKIITHLVPILPKMQQLTSLQMKGTDPVSIPHDVCLSLCTYLNQNTSLKHLAFNIYCENRDNHMIDLSKHKQLQHVDFRFSSFRTVSCNTDNLETCKLSIESGDMMKQVCNSLYKADKLKYLELYDYFSICSYKTITERLIRLLPSLVSLNTLTLLNFTFTYNVIARPCDMKNLKEITLKYVKMSMTTWCKFIDSLPALPQVAKVKTFHMDIIDGTIFEYRICDEKQKAAAHQYVREKTNLFRVTRDDTKYFHFTTKKVGL